MGNFTQGESADLFDPATGAWVGVVDQKGREQAVPAAGMTAAQYAQLAASGILTTGVAVAQTYTWAAKPLASATLPAFISDVAGGSFWLSNGTRYKPFNGSLTLYQPTTAPVTLANTAEQIVVAIPLLAGLWQDGDVITFEVTLQKSSTVDSSQTLFRVGTAAAVAGSTTNAYMYGPATTGRRGSYLLGLKRLSATSVICVNLDGTQSGLGGDTNTNTAQTVPNMDSQTTYLQVTNQMTTGAETVTFTKLIARLSTPTV